MQIIENVLNLIYPRRCPVCDNVLRYKESKDLVHEECKKKIKYIGSHVCAKCGKPLKLSDQSEYCADCMAIRHRFNRGFSVFSYRSISGSIYRFKYMGRREYADFYAKETARKLGKKLNRLGIDAIIPVPMHKDKQYLRGYNQAAEYASKLSKLTGIPMYDDVIVRTRATRPMKELDLRGRRNNLKKAFNIIRNDVKFKCILIIDDIYTTGSTIDEIAHEFRQVGVEKIYFCTLAIGQTI